VYCGLSPHSIFLCPNPIHARTPDYDLGNLQEVEDQLAIFLDEQFQTVAEDGSLEEVGGLSS